MALRKRLESEVGEDRGHPLRHSAVVLGVAATSEREVDRSVERPQRFDVEVAAVERLDESAQTRGLQAGSRSTKLSSRSPCKAAKASEEAPPPE